MLKILTYSVIVGLLFQIARGQLNSNVKSMKNDTCSSTLCSCCLENVTCATNGSCAGQCKDGYHGVNCWNNCPSNCVTCKDVYNPTGDPLLFGVANCSQCQPGNYSTSEYFQCQLSCPPACYTCNSATTCTSCVAGYFLQGPTCQPCKTGCAECSSPESCPQCSDGYYMSDNGEGCQPCSHGCKDLCNTQNRFCVCKPGFAGERCDQCAPNVQTFPLCDRCIAGFFGKDCNMICPTNCKEKVCERDVAICTHGCNGNFAGNYCTACINGWHDVACDSLCPENCIGDTCVQSSGFCQSCERNFVGNTCSECVSGWYGSDCGISCPSNCENATCNRFSGTCDSCVSGFSGDRCCLQSSSCQFCLSDSVCSKCVPGKYGDQCQMECPENCDYQVCERVNGTCITCVEGFQGERCEKPSSWKGVVSGSTTAAVVGGLVGTVVSVGVLVGVIFFLKRRYNLVCCCQNKENQGDATRRIRIYQHKQQKLRTSFEKQDRKYTEKISRLQFQLQDVHRQPDNEKREYEDMGKGNQTYESLQDQQTENHLYNDLEK